VELESQREQLDQEWYELIVTAKELGMSVDDIREFLSSVDKTDKRKGE